MENVKVSAVQMNALKDDLDHNLDVHVRFIEEAAESNCAMVLFPELSVTAHYGDPEALKFAEPAESGRIYTLMREKARQHDIIVGYGFCESAHGAYYNSQAFVGPKGMIGVQRKLHASSDEYFVFRMGRKIESFDFGFCKAGALICYDVSFSECWRILALRGVELILNPSAGRCGGMGMGKKVSKKAQLERRTRKKRRGPSIVSTHAAENAVFAVCCGQSGYNGHSTHGGGISMVDPMGYGIAGGRITVEDHSICAELDASLLTEARRQVNYTLKSRRPELYQEVAEMI